MNAAEISALSGGIVTILGAVTALIVAIRRRNAAAARKDRASE
jgi:F0F1-type ATP synthase assembly protein I